MILKTIKSSIIIRWFYWLVISIFLVLTLITWKISENQIQQKNVALFEIQSEQLLSQVIERMTHYEVALKAGAAALQSFSRDTQFNDWAQFSKALNLEDTYPGINGIGVIYHVSDHELNQFVERQREQRPDFKLHPKHNEKEFWPITYIEPFVTNKQAVGLDMAFEANRFRAARAARNSASTQITAPIILVQDAKKTPGFLQFIPFYNSSNIGTLEQRKQSFVGLVYAPFIMYKLINGTLQQNNRQIIFSVSDGKNSLYTELESSNVNYEETPLFKKEVTMEVYGRPWTFNIETSHSFTVATRSNQSLVILLSGLFIDFMLLIIFIMVSRTQQRSAIYTQEITQALSVTESYYKHIIESAPCGIIITDEQGFIEKINPQTELLFGYDEAELVGEKIDILIPKRFQKKHPEHRDSFNKNPSHRRMGIGREVFGLTQNGNEFPAEIGLAQFEDNGNLKTLATVINMTEHVQITEELQRSNKELNDFAYVASHDLKAPLRGIMQLASWIEEDIADFANEDTKDNLALLMNRTSRLEKLLGDLLTYSRIGRKEGDRKIINVRDLILNSFDLLDPPKDVTLVCQSTMPEVHTFTVPLETIFRNLMGNAIKHKSEKELLITISVKEQPKYYQFTVADNGIGIPEQHHKQIFELFKTLRPRDEVEGSGMGLSIIKKILDYQGCTINVESDGETGTSFHFTWPK